MRWWRRAVAMVALAALAACGARVSDEQVRAEARQDALFTGGSGQPGAGASGDALAGASGGSAAGATGAGASTVGAGGGSSAGGSAGAAGASGPVQTVPGGGNGGATDVGVTATEIRVGNVSTLTGPVPGLFRGALVGTQAFAAYQNSLGGVHGRKLVVVSADDRLDDGANKSKHLELSNKVFAFVGSFSVNDAGGASELKRNGVPDIGNALSTARSDLANNFSVQPLSHGWKTGPFNYYKTQVAPDVIKKVALFVADVPAARETAAWMRQVAESLGYVFVYTRNIGPTESNFTSDVVRMRQEGVKAVMFQGEAAMMAGLAKTMQDQGFDVVLPNWGAAAYDQDFIDLAGAAGAEGTRLDSSFSLFLGEDRATVPEVGLFLDWVKKIDPEIHPDLFTLYAWASARLFVQGLQAAGPAAKRSTLLAELSKIHTFDSNGILVNADPAAKKAGECFVVIGVHDGKFGRVHPKSGYECGYGPFQTYHS
jgi:ABC-type branched-subunit amino acid transport system substrate-binding protein